MSVPQSPILKKMKHMRSPIPGGISSFFSSNFPSNAVRIMSGDPCLTRVMTIFTKTYIFVKVREGKGRGGREGKGREGKEERKEGRKEGRKGGREEGRKGGRKGVNRFEVAKLLATGASVFVQIVASGWMAWSLRYDHFEVLEMCVLCTSVVFL